MGMTTVIAQSVYDIVKLYDSCWYYVQQLRDTARHYTI